MSSCGFRKINNCNNCCHHCEPCCHHDEYCCNPIFCFLHEILKKLSGIENCTCDEIIDLLKKILKSNCCDELIDLLTDILEQLEKSGIDTQELLEKILKAIQEIDPCCDDVISLLNDILTAILEIDLPCCEEIIAKLNELLSELQSINTSTSSIDQNVEGLLECVCENIIALLNEILEKISSISYICNSSNSFIQNTATTTFVTNISSEDELITAISGGWKDIPGSGNVNFVTLELGTGITSDSASFTSDYSYDVFPVIANGKFANFNLTLTHPLLIQPTSGQSVKAKIMTIGNQCSTLSSVKFNILHCKA